MGDAGRIVGVYLSRVSDHSINDALECLAPDFELEFGDSGFKLTKAQASTALEWDVGARGRLDWEVVAESQDSVTIQGSEGNEFLDLLGIGPLAFRSVFTIAPTGLIAHQLHEVSWGETSLSDAMIPLVAWASDHEPEELAEIYPEGTMRYSGPMAARWIRLAKRWREAAG